MLVRTWVNRRALELGWPPSRVPFGGPRTAMRWHFRLLASVCPLYCWLRDQPPLELRGRRGLVALSGTGYRRVTETTRDRADPATCFGHWFIGWRHAHGAVVP